MNEIAETRLVNGKRLVLTPPQAAKIEANWEIGRAGKPLKEWKLKLFLLDQKGVDRRLETVIDSMDSAQLARLDDETKAIYDEKKALRGNKPS